MAKPPMTSYRIFEYLVRNELPLKKARHVEKMIRKLRKQWKKGK